MRRLIPTALTAVVLVVTIAAAQLVPASAARPGAGSPAPSAPSALAFHSAAAGLDMTLPPGWRGADREEYFNRASLRLAVIANGPLPASPGPDRYLIPDESTVALEILQFVGPGSGLIGFDGDTTFPLDWSTAIPATDPSGAPIRLLTFIHLGGTFAIRAHLSTLASQAERDQIAGIVASIRAEPIPPSGQYHGWEVLGSLATFPIGAVRHYDRPPNEIGGYYVVRGQHHFFALVDKAYEMMGGRQPCPIHYDDRTRLFVCDATGDSWDRTGAVVKGDGPFGLAYHPIYVKDGYVLLNVGTIGGGGIFSKAADEFPDTVSR